MQPKSSLARSIYRWTAFLALPGFLWAAFEMYGLTLRGSQMLFFSIAHTMPPLVLAVFLSVPTGIAWLAQSAMALVHPAYRARLAIPQRPLVVFVAAIVVHAALLAGYGSWSGNASLRVPLCVLGLVLTGFVVREAWLWLRPARPRHLVSVAEPDA
jgi:hypothetical protein